MFHFFQLWHHGASYAIICNQASCLRVVEVTFEEKNTLPCKNLVSYFRKNWSMKEKRERAAYS